MSERASRLGWIGVLLGGLALASGQDGSGLYQVQVAVEGRRVEHGKDHRLSIAIRPEGGAHLSDEAPLKVELSGQNVAFRKPRLGRADLKSTSDAGATGEALFEAPFVAERPGKATIEAKMTFFVCTQTLCARQVRTVDLPLEVD